MITVFENSPRNTKSSSAFCADCLEVGQSIGGKPESRARALKKPTRFVCGRGIHERALKKYYREQKSEYGPERSKLRVKSGYADEWCAKSLALATECG